jgi:hypothetical protein
MRNYPSGKSFQKYIRVLDVITIKNDDHIFCQSVIGWLDMIAESVEDYKDEFEENFINFYFDKNIVNRVIYFLEEKFNYENIDSL